MSSVSQAPFLFLGEQPAGSSGLARRLNPLVHYLAMRWDYSKTPKADLLNRRLTIKAVKITGITIKDCIPADWGPNEATGRIADLSEGLLRDLGIETDDECEISFQ